MRTALLFIVLLSSGNCFFEELFGDMEQAFDILAGAVGDSDFQNYVQGIMNGIGERKSITELAKCMKEGDTIMSNIKDGLEKTRPMDIESIKEGLKMVFAGFQDFFSMVQNCLSDYYSLKQL